jgi:UDP-N-acetylglucosamine/UDP-N-acetyl-alpha-D-glucosaminouronate 4-epimerase
MANENGRLIMVTGGAGFIGSHIVDALLKQNFRVRVIDNFSTGNRNQLDPRAELFDADIIDLKYIKPAFSGVDCVFHTAALPRVPLSIERPLETHVANVIGTLNVLIAARDSHVRRVVYSGSSSVYGEQSCLPFNEHMRPNPMSPYALQKLTGEEYTRLFHRLYGMETLTLRYFNVFGPRMTTEGAYVTVIAVFLRARGTGDELTIYGDGEQTRDFTHVSDVVQANLLAMDCRVADGRAINVGHGRNVSVNHIAEIVGGPKLYLPPRPGEPRHTLADRREAERILNWKPFVTVEAGLEQLLNGTRCYESHLAPRDAPRVHDRTS